MSTQLGNWHPMPPIPTQGPWSPFPTTFKPYPQPSCGDPNPGVQTSSRVRTRQGEEQKRAWQGEQWGLCQPPPVPQFPGSS